MDPISALVIVSVIGASAVVGANREKLTEAIEHRAGLAEDDFGDRIVLATELSTDPKDVIRMKL